MAPIYDSDLAEQRWAKAEWEQYELWEKVELRLRKSRRRWIRATALLVIILFAIPIVGERKDKWSALRSTRILAQELSRLKRDASIHRTAQKIRFLGNGSLSYVIEEVSSCQPPALNEQTGTFLRQGTLSDSSELSLLNTQNGLQLGIPGLVEEFCYDSHKGVHFPPSLTSSPLLGFAIVPVKDLTNSQTHRASVLLVSGSSGELTFE